MFLSRRFCAALSHATALPNSSLHTPLCEIYFACFAVGESLLLRQHLKPYCLVGFRVSVKEILCGVVARNCVAELFVAHSALRNLFRLLRCWRISSSPPTPETLLFSRVSRYFKIELSHAVQQPSKHLLGTAV